METKIPGLKSGHQIITAECRATRGTTGAFDEAAERLRRLYDNYARAEANAGVNWHLVLVRDDGKQPSRITEEWLRHRIEAEPDDCDAEAGSMSTIAELINAEVEAHQRLSDAEADIEKEVHSRVEHWRSANERVQDDCGHLRDAIRDLLASYDPERAVIDVEPDDGCMECTVGTTPRQTGPCVYHRALALVGKPAE